MNKGLLFLALNICALHIAHLIPDNITRFYTESKLFKCGCALAELCKSGGVRAEVDVGIDGECEGVTSFGRCLLNGEDECCLACVKEMCVSNLFNTENRRVIYKEFAHRFIIGTGEEGGGEDKGENSIGCEMGGKTFVEELDVDIGAPCHCLWQFAFGDKEGRIADNKVKLVWMLPRCEIAMKEGDGGIGVGMGFLKGFEIGGIEFYTG